MNPSSFCHVCDGTGWRPIDEDGVTARRVVRCDCVLARQQRQRIGGSGIPPKYHACTFANYRAYNDSMRHALTVAQGFAEAYPILPHRGGALIGQGLLFIGPVGLGKTHLASALLTEIIARTRTWGLFYKTRDLLRLIRDSYNPATKATEAQILDPIVRCDLLVLDDLGAERTTDWVDETMNYIIDTRYSACRPVIITTNYPDVDEIDEVNGLLCRIGFRMRSRLREMCQYVELEGADYRDLPVNGSEADLRRLWKAQPHTKTAPARPTQRRSLPTPHDGKADLKWPGGKGGNA